MPSTATGPDYSRMDPERVREIISDNAARVARLGNWPEYIKSESLTERVPRGEEASSGFDAGIACALGIIPADKQALSAGLHAHYTPELVKQVRDEMKNLQPDDAACWWLACCALCREGEVTTQMFREQLSAARELSRNPEKRLELARQEFQKMLGKFYFTPETGNTIPFGTEDGAAQGAYLAGYPVAVVYAQNYGIYFLSTMHETLGLENFQWSEKKDPAGRPMSGPVWGSRQFVKCADLEELQRALEIVRSTFSAELTDAPRSGETSAGT